MSSVAPIPKSLSKMAINNAIKKLEQKKQY